MGFLSTTAIAAIAFCVGFVFRRRNFATKAVPWLWLLAGFGLAGLFGNLLVSIGGALTSATTQATAVAFGVGVPVLLAIVIGVLLLVDMRPRAAPGRLTPWLALVFPSILATAGGVFAQLHATADSYLTQGAAALGAFFESVVSGL